MAGGKLTPRQKMINMMYLVLTAMLALNVSQDILRALTDLNYSMEETVAQVEDGNQLLYNALIAEASEKDKAKPWNAKAQAMKPEADAAWQMIEDAKRHLIVETGDTIEGENGAFKGADNRDVGQNYLVNPESIGGGGMAKKIRTTLEQLRDNMIASIENDPSASLDDQTAAAVNSLITFPNVIGHGDDTPRPWEEAKFAELPLAGVIPFLTELQANVRRAESAMLKYYADGIDLKSVSFDAVQPVILTNSSYVMQGDNYEAKVFLAAYDSQQNPTFTLNGEPVEAEMVADGMATITLPGSGVGVKSFTGSILLPGADSAVSFEGEYTVAPPTAVISPTAMNVLYRQVDNPLEISVPGVQPENLVVSGPGLRQTSPGNYVANITNVSGSEVNITVGVREEDGSTRNIGSKKFRLKGLPKPEAQIYRRSTPGPYSADLIANATVEAAYQDFVFDLSLTVTGFEIVVPGQAPIRVNGNRLTSAAQQAVRGARPGSLIMIRDVKATINGSGQRVQNINNLTVQVQ